MIDLKNIKLLTILVLCASLMMSACTDKTTDVKTDAPAVEDGEKVQEEVIENKLGFENVALLKAVAGCFDKKADELTEEDILSVKYLGVGPEADGKISVCIGLQEYSDVYFSQEVTIEKLQEHVKTQLLEDENGTYGDLAKFKNVEVFEYYNIPISDVSFVKDYEDLAFGYFMDNGITDVSSLEGYNPETLYELDFTGNEIADWTPLYDIKDRVIVNYTLEKMTDGEGNEVDVPFVTTLADVLEAENGETQQEPEDSALEQPEETQAQTQTETEPEVTYSDIDWSALFGE